MSLSSVLASDENAIADDVEPKGECLRPKGVQTMGKRMVDYDIKLDVVLQHDDDRSGWIWFHPRVAPMPGFGKDGGVAVLMTLQKHLQVSDFYSGVFFMRSDDLGKTWTKPECPPELDWRKEPSGVIIAVCDVTPGWHSQTGKVIAIGARVRYDPKGHQLEDIPRAHQTAYAIYDPKTNRWTSWRTVEMPKGEQFNFCRSACSQWVLEPDGTLLVPFYHGKDARSPWSITVARFKFDGETLTYVERGNTLSYPVARGLAEPSLIQFHGRYYLTIRHDHTAFVSVSEDGLHFEPIKRWTFDDGTELGSYNTQQHWLVHSNGLFLVYTRKGANNDHIMRHRAPLFIAQVDPERLCVIRDTERVLIPESGAPMGNFGATLINEWESWVTVSEFMYPTWNEQARKRGACGRTFVARVVWKEPNEFSLVSIAKQVCRDIRGFNYFASYASTLEEMWGNYKQEVWSYEMAIARRAGANTIRFWLSPKVYGRNPKQFLRNLEQALSAARDNNLLCIPVLFNAWRTSRPEWAVGHITAEDMCAEKRKGFERYVRAVVSRFKDDQRVLMWEICNEPDLYADLQPFAVEFCEHWYEFIKRIGARQPVTIGLASVANLERFVHCQDILNFHFYDTEEVAIRRVIQIAKDVSWRYGKPVFCSETGTARSNQLEHRRNVELQTRLLEENDIGFILPWLVRAKAADTCPERSLPHGLGCLALFEPDGTPREAAKAIRWNRKIHPLIAK